MELELAEKIAREEMAAWGLFDQGWTFRWDRAVKRLGQACWTADGKPKAIGLSREPVRLNSEETVRDTILHEIAHALAGHDAGHGPAWKAWCRQVGANPKRCAELDTVQVPLRYEFTCPNGHKSYRKRRPTTGRRNSCAVCNPKRFDERYVLTWRDTHDYAS